jgi:hypothetical protein
LQPVESHPFFFIEYRPAPKAKPKPKAKPEEDILPGWETHMDYIYELEPYLDTFHLFGPTKGQHLTTRPTRRPDPWHDLLPDRPGLSGRYSDDERPED